MRDAGTGARVEGAIEEGKFLGIEAPPEHGHDGFREALGDV